MQYGELEKLDGGRVWRLRFSRRFEHPAEKVWRAITEPQHLAAWFPTTIDGERKVGATLTFVLPPEIKIPPFQGRMLVWDPEKVIEFEWGQDIIRMELQPDGNGTRFSLYDALDEHGKAARDAAGWHQCLEKLENHLGNDLAGSSDWKLLFALYGHEFGPEAARIGPPKGHPEAE